MELPLLPADQLSAKPAGEFPPGTLIFTPYAWYGAEPLQLGIRVGDGAEIFALTPWHGGHSAAGTIVTSRSDRPVFGLHPERKARLYLNPSATSVELKRNQETSGLVGLSGQGMVLASKRPEPGFQTFSHQYLIDPITWRQVERSAGGTPEIWFADWQVRIELPGNETFVASVASEEA